MSPPSPKHIPVTANPGVLVGAAFGVLFLVFNSGAPLPVAVGVAVKGVAAAAAVAVLWAQLSPHRPRAGDLVAQRSGLGRPFRLVVVAEVAIGAAGLAALRSGGAHWQANVAWIAAVVGVHFLALAIIWRDLGISVVGSVMAIVGVAGLAMAAAGIAVAWIPAVSGVTSGFTLVVGSLAASIWERNDVPSSESAPRNAT